MHDAEIKPEVDAVRCLLEDWNVYSLQITTAKTKT